MIFYVILIICKVTCFYHGFLTMLKDLIVDILYHWVRPVDTRDQRSRQIYIFVNSLHKISSFLFILNYADLIDANGKWYIGVTNEQINIYHLRNNVLCFFSKNNFKAQNSFEVN